MLLRRHKATGRPMLRGVGAPADSLLMPNGTAVPTNYHYFEEPSAQWPAGRLWRKIVGLNGLSSAGADTLSYPNAPILDPNTAEFTVGMTLNTVGIPTQAHAIFSDRLSGVGFALVLNTGTGNISVQCRKVSADVYILFPFAAPTMTFCRLLVSWSPPLNKLIVTTDTDQQVKDVTTASTNGTTLRQTQIRDATVKVASMWRIKKALTEAESSAVMSRNQVDMSQADLWFQPSRSGEIDGLSFKNMGSVGSNFVLSDSAPAQCTTPFWVPVDRLFGLA